MSYRFSREQCWERLEGKIYFVTATQEKMVKLSDIKNLFMSTVVVKEPLLGWQERYDRKHPGEDMQPVN